MFFIVYFSTLAGVRALDPQAGADGADRRRERAPGRAPHRVSRRGAVDLRRLSHRGALCHRRRGDRRADLVQSRARLSGADRRDELRHHRGVRRDPCRHRSSFMPPTGCVNAAERLLLRWRPPPPAMLDTGPEHERHAAARDQEPRQALSGARQAASRRRGSSRTCRSRSAPANSSPSSARRAPASRRCSTSSRRSTRRAPARSCSTASRVDSRDPKALQPGPRPPHRLCHAGRQPAAVAHDHRQRAVPARGAGHARRREPRARADDADRAPSGSPASSAIIRTSCPAACASAPR